ncbi:MAG: methyl-accepting chemotaxis protein [Pirellulales bacterium]|nr:methyl-accepting chemotaxis protein [Pirellulales bacterium]
MRLLAKFNVLRSLSLRRRLLLGFVSSALLAAGAAAAGIVSLWAIESNMRTTTEGIGELIDNQDAQSRCFAALRGLSIQITGATTDAELNEAQKALHNACNSEMGRDKNNQAVRESVKTLLTKKRDALNSAKELDSLLENSSTVLQAITSASEGIASLSETEAMSSIESSSSDVQKTVSQSQDRLSKDLQSVSDGTGKMISTVKTALTVRSHAQALDSQIKESLLSDDPATVEYTGKTVTTLLGNVRTALGELPQTETVKSLQAAFEQLPSPIEKMLTAKRELILRQEEGKDAIEKLRATNALLNQTLGDLNEVTLEIADTSEFDSTVAVDTALEQIRTANTEKREVSSSDLDTLSNEMSKAITTIKTAMGVRGRAQELGALVRECLFADDAAVLDYTRKQASTLLESAAQGLAELPESDNRTKLNKSFEKLSGLIDQIIGAKSQVLDRQREKTLADKELLVSAKTIRESLNKIDEMTLEVADAAEFDAAMAVDDKFTQIKKEAALRGTNNSQKVKEISGITGKGISTIKAALGIRAFANRFNVTVREAMIATDAAVVKQLQGQLAGLIERTNTALGSLNQTSTTRTVKQKVQELALIVERMFQAKNRSLDAQKALSEASFQISQYLSELEQTMLASAQQVKTEAETTLQATSDAVAWWQGLELFLGIGVVVFALIVGLIASAAITRPLGQTIALIKDIAEGEGDLTKRLDDSRRDELGELAGWFNTFVSKLQNLVQEIARDAATLSTSANALSATASEMAQGSEDMSDESATVATAAKELATKIDGMAQSTRETSENARSVASAVEEMTITIGQVASNAEQASKVAADAARLAHTSTGTIGDLSEAATAIGKVIETIQDIAEQTNLLALNATIEAARAGEAGSGFAVVANEVKQLARQTAEATEDIRVRIEGIQASTGQAVQSMSDISKVIEQVDEVSRTIAATVEQQNVAAKEIAQNVARSTTATETIAQGIAQSAEVCQGISLSIDQVDGATKQAAEGAHSTKNSSNQLATIATSLSQLVGQFKTAG